MSPGLLSDLKVVEYGHYISAPYCAKLLGDLGASVIKVEDPEGDVARRTGPFPGDVPNPEKSGLFLALNTSKRGVTLDLRTDNGRDLLLRLLDTADIFVENNHPGVLDSLGLDYETLNRRNPRLVVTSMTPFGLTGPYSDFKATDLVTFHMSGYAPIIPGGVEDTSAEPPLRAGGHQAEFVAGVTAASATMLAISLRARNGRGTHVDLSALEAMIMMPQGAISDAAFGRGPASRLRGTTVPGALVAILPTSDGYVAVSPREEHQWTAWLELMGNPSWGSDERFTTRRDRQRNWTELEPLLIEWSSHEKKEDVYRRAQEAHIPAFPVNTAGDLFQSVQLQSRGFFREMDHPVAGRLPYTGIPFTLSNTNLEIQGPAPTLGQHNAEVLDGLR
ncbi:MAG: CoA transferase [Dehalococcoidia bacterium]